MGQFEPVKLRTDEADIVEEREPFFYLDDVEYTIPKRIAPALTLRFLDQAAEGGELGALSWLMRELLGDEAVDALQESESMTDEDMATLMGYLSKKVVAAQKRQLGNSSSGRRR
jgi:hypothetical protein